jgi:hypothetical protein
MCIVSEDQLSALPGAPRRMANRNFATQQATGGRSVIRQADPAPVRAA